MLVLNGIFALIYYPVRGSQFSVHLFAGVCVCNGSARVCPMAMQIHLFCLFVVSHSFWLYSLPVVDRNVATIYRATDTNIIIFSSFFVGFAFAAASPFWENVIIFHFICVHQFIFFIWNFSCFSSSRSTDLFTSCDVGQSRGQMSEHVPSFFSILFCVLINMRFGQVMTNVPSSHPTRGERVGNRDWVERYLMLIQFHLIIKPLTAEGIRHQRVGCVLCHVRSSSASNEKSDQMLAIRSKCWPGYLER